MKRWEVTWIDKDELAKVVKAGAKREEMTEEEYTDYHGIFDLYTDAEFVAYFPNRGLAKAFAKRILPKDAVGEVRIDEEVSTEIDPHDGGPNLIDWEPVGDTEYVS
jgi:hypothetical protein